MLPKRWLLSAIAFAFVSVASLASEQEVEVSTAGKAREIAGRFEVDFFLYDVSVRNIFVEHPYSAHVNIAYHFLDWLSLEAIAGYSFISRETALSSRIRNEMLDPSRGITLPELWSTTWQAGGNLVFAPINGKVSFWSEVQNHFQVYAFVPLMGEGIRRIGSDSKAEISARFATGLGAGARIFAADLIAVRAEVRQMFGFNPSLPDGTSDLSSTTWLQFGVGYLF